MNFLNHIVSSLGRFICIELDRFFQAQPQKWVCIEVDLSKDLKDSVDIQIGALWHTQKVTYFNLPNTCYRCHSADHKIKDCSLAVPHTPSSLQETEKPHQADNSATKLDEKWTTVMNRKNKSNGSRSASKAPKPTKNVSNPSIKGKEAPTEADNIPMQPRPKTTPQPTVIMIAQPNVSPPMLRAQRRSHSPSLPLEEGEYVQEKWRFFSPSIQIGLVMPEFLQNHFSSLNEEESDSDDMEEFQS